MNKTLMPTVPFEQDAKAPITHVGQASGVISMHIGGKTRSFKFKNEQVSIIEAELESSMLDFIGRGGSSTTFLVCALRHSHVSDDPRDRPTPRAVAAWLDDTEISQVEMCTEILYARARSMRGEEGRRAVEALDEGFKRGKFAPVPVSASASSSTTKETKPSESPA